MSHDIHCCKSSRWMGLTSFAMNTELPNYTIVHAPTHTTNRSKTKCGTLSILIHTSNMHVLTSNKECNIPVAEISVFRRV